MNTQTVPNEISLTLTTMEGDHIAVIGDEDVSLNEIFEGLVIPVLKVAGYSEADINHYINTRAH